MLKNRIIALTLILQWTFSPVAYGQIDANPNRGTVPALGAAPTATGTDPMPEPRQVPLGAPVQTPLSPPVTIIRASEGPSAPVVRADVSTGQRHPPPSGPPPDQTDYCLSLSINASLQKCASARPEILQQIRTHLAGGKSCEYLTDEFKGSINNICTEAGCCLVGCGSTSLAVGQTANQQNARLIALESQMALIRDREAAAGSVVREDRRRTRSKETDDDDKPGLFDNRWVMGGLGLVVGAAAGWFGRGMMDNNKRESRWNRLGPPGRFEVPRRHMAGNPLLLPYMGGRFGGGGGFGGSGHMGGGRPPYYPAPFSPGGGYHGFGLGGNYNLNSGFNSTIYNGGAGGIGGAPAVRYYPGPQGI